MKFPTKKSQETGPAAAVADRLEKAQGLPELFALVKDIAHQTAGLRRSGLMLGLGDLGVSAQGFVGAYYPADSNLIVVNERALELVRHRLPKLYKPYLFHVLLHEYVHALGEYDESACRRKVAAICAQAFGQKHAVTRLASDPSSLAPLLHPTTSKPGNRMDAPVRLIRGFDADATRHYS